MPDVQVVGRRTYALCGITGVLIVGALAAVWFGDEKTADMCRTAAALSAAGAVAALRAAK